MILFVVLMMVFVMCFESWFSLRLVCVVVFFLSVRVCMSGGGRVLLLILKFCRLCCVCVF